MTLNIRWNIPCSKKKQLPSKRIGGYVMNMYAGLLIKESLSDERILDFVEIKDVDIWATNNTPRYWTAVSFVSDCIDFPEKLSKALKEDSQMIWYVDLKADHTKYIVIKDLVLKYEIGNQIEKESVIKKCIELGMPMEQLDWSEE